MKKSIRSVRFAVIVLVVSTMNCGCSTTRGGEDESAQENVEIIGGGRTRISFVRSRVEDGSLVITGVVSPRGSRVSGGHGHVDVEMLDEFGVKVAKRSVTYTPHYLSRRESTRFTAQFDRGLPEKGKLVVRHHLGVHFPHGRNGEASSVRVLSTETKSTSK